MTTPRISSPPRRILPLLLSCAAVLCFGCSKEDPGPPYRALVYAYDKDRAEYDLTEVGLDTLRSLDGLEGEVTTIIGGVEISIDLFAPVDSPEQLVEAVRVKGGSPVDVRWFMRDGAVVAEDFGSLILLTYYHHMERCRAFFHEHGVPSSIPGHIRTFFLPKFGSMGFAFHLVKDNAAYSPVFEAFALFPRQLLIDHLPLAMNLGVVCHEYSHGVFHAIVAGDSRVPVGTLSGWPASAENIMRSVDEGLADIAGALVTNDPDFISISLPGYVDIGRDLGEVRPIDEDILFGLGRPTEHYDPYPLGNVLASVLWATKEIIGAEELGFAAVRYMYEMAARAGPELDLATIAEVVLVAVPERGRTAICDALATAAFPIPDECEET